MNVNISDLNRILLQLDGDYITAKQGNNGQWYIRKERCCKGSVPIGDARFRYEVPKGLSGQEVLKHISSVGFPQDRIIIAEV